MYELLEVIHGDRIALFKTKEEAEAVLIRILKESKKNKGKFGITEIDENGSPTGKFNLMLEYSRPTLRHKIWRAIQTGGLSILTED